MEVHSVSEARIAQSTLVNLRRLLELTRGAVTELEKCGRLSPMLAGLEGGFAIATADLEDRIAEIDDAVAAWLATYAPRQENAQ